MPIEIACGNCGNTFGVEAQWAGLVVECPFCQTTVQVPEEVAQLAEAATQTESPDFQEIQPASEPQEPVAIKTGPAEISSTKGDPSNSSQAKPGRSKSSRLKSSQSPRAETSPPTTSQAGTGTPAPATKKSQDSLKTKPQRSKPPVTPPIIESEISHETPQTASPSGEEGTGEPLANTATPSPLPIPGWRTPPTVGWLSENVDGDLGQVKVVVRVGTTTIQYQGERVVLRDQPTVRQWYGTVMFFLSVITLALILTGLYFLYRV